MNTTLQTLESLYASTTDLTLTWQDLDRTFYGIMNQLSTSEVKQLAKAFNVWAMPTKTATIDRMYHKISERKARCERGQLIADAVVR